MIPDHRSSSVMNASTDSYADLVTVRGKNGMIRGSCRFTFATTVEPDFCTTHDPEAVEPRAVSVR
jgi:hypothetical protein